MTALETQGFQAFILTNTRIKHAPLVPEIALHLASEVLPLWQEAESLMRAGMPPPYWAFAWPGGQALARYVLDNPEFVDGFTVLDFGSGSGLVAIAAARSGARATAADIDAFALAAIGLNGGINGVVVEILGDDLIGSEGPWDVILIGDMCYERPLAERMVGWLTGLAAKGTRVLLGDPGRSYFPASGVERIATYAVPTSKDLEDREIRETSVYRLLA